MGQKQHIFWKSNHLFLQLNCCQVPCVFLKFITGNPFPSVPIPDILMVCNLSHHRVINSCMLTSQSAYFAVAVFLCWLGRFSFYGLWDFHLTTPHPSTAEEQQQQQHSGPRKVMIMLRHTFCFWDLCTLLMLLTVWGDRCSPPNPPSWTSHSVQCSLLPWCVEER